MLKDEIIFLNKQFLEQSYHVSDMFQKCIEATLNYNLDTLKEVIEVDEMEVNAQDIEIEKKCINILALHQPAAKDLREIIMILKINEDLERIADIVTNIAESAIKIQHDTKALEKINIKKMADKTQKMMTDVIKSYLENNTKLAIKICERDDIIDDMRDDHLKEITQDMMKNPDAIEVDLHLLRISKSLERIADHITNIAENIVYIEKAKIIKHQDN